jgi:hypothetical protein
MQLPAAATVADDEIYLPLTDDRLFIYLPSHPYATGIFF